MKTTLRYAAFVALVAGTLAMGGCGGGGGGVSAPEAASSSGAVSQTTVTAPQTPQTPQDQQSTGVAKLAWEASTGDGPVAGYRVCYGSVPGAYTKVLDVGTTTTCTIENLPKGRYYFAVTAYDAAGAESSYSNEVSKDL